MTVLFKLIIRFDFSPIYQVLDKKGTCFLILNSVSQGFWKTLGDGLNPHISIAQYLEPNVEYRHIAIEPTSLVILWENYPDMDIDKLSSSTLFKTFDNI